MRVDQVEIYSDKTNAAILRHPDRRFPGVLVQGDSLSILCKDADQACNAMGRGAAGYEQLNAVRNTLWAYLVHYKATLGDHGMPLPFNDDVT